MNHWNLRSSGGQMKHLLEYVQKLRQKGGLIEIRSPHTGGSIIRAYGATGDMKGVWDTWNDPWLTALAAKRVNFQAVQCARLCSVYMNFRQPWRQKSSKVIQSHQKSR